MVSGGTHARFDNPDVCIRTTFSNADLILSHLTNISHILSHFITFHKCQSHFIAFNTCTPTPEYSTDHQ